jgi:hypothetical protein
LVEWRLAGETEVLGENLPQRHFVPHKSHDQTRDRTRAAAVGSQWLTAWTMARPTFVKMVSVSWWSVLCTCLFVCFQQPVCATAAGALWTCTWFESQSGDRICWHWPFLAYVSLSRRLLGQHREINTIAFTTAPYLPFMMFPWNRMLGCNSAYVPYLAYKLILRYPFVSFLTKLLFRIFFCPPLLFLNI